MRLGARGVWWGGALAVAFGVAAVTCGPSSQSSSPQSSPDSENLLPAFGHSLEGWGLVGLPVEGGAAVYRSLPALDLAAWSSGTALPPLRQAVGGPEGAAVVSARGEISWYGLKAERVDRLGRSRAARLIGLRGGGEGVLAVEAGTREVAVLGGGAAWKAVADGTPTWADWLEGERLLVLSTRDDGRSLLTLYKPPLETVLRRVTLEVTGVPAVTAWGSLVYVPGKDPNGRPALRALGASDLGERGAIALPSEAAAVAATPSGHRLYAASKDGHVHAVNRVDGRLLRTIALPAPADRLRFNRTGEILLAGLAGTDSVAVILAGVDRLAGVLPAEWDENLPWAAPGGRYVVARREGRLRVYESPDLRRAAEAPDAGGHLWWPLAWVPPEKAAPASARGIEPESVRPESVRAADRTLPSAPRRESPVALAEPPAEAAGRSAAQPEAGAGGAVPDRGAPAGVYAVVSAARTPDGIRELSAQLAAEGFPASIDRYVDELGTVWYRAMIGPYRDRPGAEEAAARVALRRGVRPWILEIQPPSSPSPR